jgi:hypothetical protein
LVEGEVPSDAQQAATGPVDLLGLVDPQDILQQQLELGLVVE